MKKIVVLILLVAFSIFLSSCGEERSNNIEKDLSNIKIPVLAPVSGPAATYGEDAVNAYKTVINSVNSNGGINGRQVELIVEDTKCSGKDAVGAVQKLINVDNAQVIVGAICSASTVPAGKIAQSKKIPMISPVSSAPDIANIGSYIKRYWNDDNATTKTAKFMELKGVKNLAIIAENTDYGVGYANGIKSNFSGNIVFEENFNSDEKDFSIIAKKVKQVENIDALIIIPNSDSSTIGNLQALDKEGLLENLRGKIYGTEVIFTDTIKKTIGADKLEGIYTTTMPSIDTLSKEASEFIDSFKANYEIKSDSLFVMLEAETMMVVLDAIKDVGYDKDKIQKYLSNISEDNKRNGLFGEYHFEGVEAIGLDFLVKQYKNGKLEIVK